MRNSDYWKKRFEQLEDERYIQTEEFYKDLEKQFRKAQLEVQSDIEKWYWRLAENNEISYAKAKKLLKGDELEEFKWKVEDYIKYGQENGIDQKWMKQLENASARVHISRLEAIKIQMRQQAEKIFALYEGDATEFLKNIYENGFYKTAFSIAKGTGEASELVKLNPSTIETVIMKPWAQDGKNFSERIWTNKEKLVNVLHTELTQNVLRGTSPEKASKVIAEKMGVSARQARTLVYTESAAIASKAQQDCFNELELERYEILATLDSRTSDICREMDKKVFEMKDYQVGVTAPPFHPRCRSCTCPFFDDEFTVMEKRSARNEETGKVYYVPANMSYAEWKEAFVDNKEVPKEYKIIKSLPFRDIKGKQSLKAIIEAMPIKLQEVLKDTRVIIDSPHASSYYESTDIMHLSKTPTKEEIWHETGHVLEYKLIDSKELSEIKQKYVERLGLENIRIATGEDKNGNRKEVFVLESEKFLDYYQSRICADSIEECFDSEGNIDATKMYEFVSVALEKYSINPAEVQEKQPDLYEFIERMIR